MSFFNCLVGFLVTPKLEDCWFESLHCSAEAMVVNVSVARWGALVGFGLSCLLYLVACWGYDRLLSSENDGKE